MKIQTYIKKLQQIAKNNPDAIVIYSSDEEGNSFNEVLREPEVIYYNREEREINDIKYDGFVIAVCIN
jgi:hypothetical protein